MPEQTQLENLIASCNSKNQFQLYPKKATEKHCWMLSKNHPDFNLEVKINKLGYFVSFYNSTYDQVSGSAISEEHLLQGLTLLLQTNVAPDDENICKLLAWN